MFPYVRNKLTTQTKERKRMRERKRGRKGGREGREGKIVGRERGGKEEGKDSTIQNPQFSLQIYPPTPLSVPGS